MGEPSTPSDTGHSGLQAAKNTVVLVGLRVAAPALSVLLLLVLSRVLKAEGVGRYVLAYGFLNILGSLGPLGLQAVVIRDGAADKSLLQRVLSNAMTLGVATSVLLTAIMLGTSLVMGYDPPTTRAMVVLSLAVLPTTLGAFLEAGIVAIQRTEFIAIGTLAEYALKIGAGVVLLYRGHGLEAVLLMAVAGRALACVIEARLLSGAGVRVGFGLDKPLMRNLLRLAPTFLGIAVFATLYWRIDILMLSKMRPIDDVGYYGAAWRLMFIGMVVPQGLCLALYPQIAAAVRTDASRLIELSAIALRYLIAISLPVAVCAALAGPKLLALVYSESFVEAGTTLTVLIWTLVPYGLVRYHAHVLVAADQQRIDLLVNVLMTAINIALNLLFIPLYGPVGAAAATLSSICLYAVVQYAWLRRSLPQYTTRVSVPVAVVLGSVFAGLCVWALQGVHVSVGLAAAIVVYAATLLGGRFFSNEELQLLGIARFLPHGWQGKVT